MIKKDKLIDDLDRKLYAMQIVPRSAVLDIVKEQPIPEPYKEGDSE